MKSLPKVSLSDIDELFGDEKKASLKEIDEIFNINEFVKQGRQFQPQTVAPVSTAVSQPGLEEEEELPDERLVQALEDIETAYPVAKPQPPEEPPRVFESLAKKIPEPLLREVGRGIGKALDIGPRSIMGGVKAGAGELEKAYKLLEEKGIEGVPEAVLRTVLGATHGMFGTMMGTSPSGLAFLGTQEAAVEAVPEAGPMIQKALSPVSTTAEVLGEMMGIPPSREELGGITGVAKDIGDLFGQIYMFTKTHKRVSEAGKTKQELAFIEAQPKFERARPEGAASEIGDYQKDVVEWSVQFEKQFPNLYKSIQAKLKGNIPLTPGEKNVVDSFTRKMMRRQIPTTKETPVTDDEALELLQGITDDKGQRLYSDDQIARLSSQQRIYYASGGRQGSKDIEKPKKAEVPVAPVTPPVEVLKAVSPLEEAVKNLPKTPEEGPAGPIVKEVIQPPPIKGEKAKTTEEKVVELGKRIEGTIVELESKKKVDEMGASYSYNLPEGKYRFKVTNAGARATLIPVDENGKKIRLKDIVGSDIDRIGVSAKMLNEDFTIVKPPEKPKLDIPIIPKGWQERPAADEGKRYFVYEGGESGPNYYVQFQHYDKTWDFVQGRTIHRNTEKKLGNFKTPEEALKYAQVYLTGRKEEVGREKPTVEVPKAEVTPGEVKPPDLSDLYDWRVAKNKELTEAEKIPDPNVRIEKVHEIVDRYDKLKDPSWITTSKFESIILLDANSELQGKKTTPAKAEVKEVEGWQEVPAFGEGKRFFKKGEGNDARYVIFRDFDKRWDVKDSKLKKTLGTFKTPEEALQWAEEKYFKTKPEEVKITEPIQAPPTKKGKKTTVKEPENIVESNVEEYQKRSTDIDTEYETAWDKIKKLTDDINKARSMKIVGGEGSEEPLKKQIDVLMKRRAEIMKQKGVMDQQIGETISKKLEEKAPELDDESHSSHIEKVFEWIENPAFKDKKVSQVIDEYIDKEVKKTVIPKPAAPTVPEFKEPEEIAGTEPTEIKIVKEPAGPKDSERLKVYDVPLSMIKKDVDAFQNRYTEYSEETVNKIMDDIDKGTFKYYKYDPIILWKNPDDGELYILAGHSRVEAFTRANESMSRMGEYSEIPAQIIEGKSKEEAIKIAKTSNKRHTNELPIEKAKYYRDLREQGKSEKEVEAEAKIYDGKAHQGLLNLSYLNPKGRTVEAIRMIGEEGETAREMRDITEWIGYIRRMTPELTDIHESEMFDWLKTNYKDRGVGIKNRVQFVDTIERVTNVKEGFDYSKKLNLDTFIPRDKTAREYLQKIEDAKLDIKVAEEVLANKEKEFIARRDDPAVVDKALTPYREAVIIAKRDFMYLKDNKEKVLQELADTELSLFDDINKIEERMKDEEYSEPDIKGVEEGRIVDTAPEGTPPEEAPANTIPGKAGKTKKRVLKDSTYLDAKKRLDDKLIGNLSGFFFGDPESIADIIKIGAYHIESGVQKLDEFRTKMKMEFGPFFDRLSGRVEEIFKRSIAYWKECYVLNDPEFSKSIDKSNIIDENGIPIPVNSDRFNKLFDEKFKKLLSVPETKAVKIESWNNVIGESVKRFNETGGISPGMATVDISKYPKGNLATGEKVAYILEPIFEKAKYEATMLIRQGKLAASDFSDYVHKIVNDMLLSNKAFSDMKIDDRNLFYREIRSRGELYRYNPDNRILDEVPRGVQASSMSSLDALLTPQVKADFGESDLNEVLTLRQIGKNFANNLNKVPGKDVRFGLIKRFRRAVGLYFGDSGLIRLRNINELDVFAHEVGHQIDMEIFDYTGKIKFDKADQIEKALIMHLGRFKTDPVKKAKLMDTLYKKYGRDIVDGIDHRFQMRQELKKNILKDYPSDKITEGVAQFVKFYVVDPARALKDAPLFHSFFENLLFNNEPLKSALHSAREQFKEYKSQDPRQLYESKVVRKSDDGNNWLAGITKLFGKKGLYYNIVNSLGPIRDLGEKLKEYDPNSPPSENPYAKVLTVFGSEGKQKQFLENHPFIKTGEDINIRYDIPPLLEILRKMVEDNTLRSHEGFLDAMRDLDLYEAGKGGAALMPKQIAEETIKLFRQSNGDEYADNLVRDLKKYNDSVIDYYQSSGKISKKTADQMKEIYNVYVPYKRFFDEYESSGGTINLGKKISDSSPSPVKVIRKSVREIHSPIESLVKNTYDLIVAADRNDALKSIVDGLNKIDPHLVQEIPGRVVTPVKVLENGNIELKFALEFKKPQNAEIVTVWSDGKPHYYQIPKEYYDSFFSVYEPYSKALRKLAMPTNWLRAGAVVYDPTFGFRNIPRDQISGTFYSKYGYNPYHFFKGIFSAINKTEYYQKFLASGADLSFLATLDKAVDFSQSRLKSASHLESLWKRYMHKAGIINLAKDFNRATELGTRVGAFRNAYLKTGNVWSAMEEARNIGGDYSIQGATMKNISPLYAFLNARMRHDENTLRTFGVKRVAGTLGKGVTWIVAPSVLLWLSNNLDPERRKLYRELPLWRKSQFFNIPIPGTDNFLPVPKGYYGVLFGSIPEAVMEMVFNEEMKQGKDFPRALFQEFSPMSDIMDAVPTFARPIAEQFANKIAYTDRAIVPGNEKIAPEEQYTDLTPEFIKEIGKMIGVSPARMEAFITGYTAGAGRNTLYVTDEILQTLGIVDRKPEDTFDKLSRMPITRAFVGRTYIGVRSESIQSFYRKLDDLETINNTVNKMIRDEKGSELNQYMKGHETDYRYYIKNQKEINRFKDLIRGVRDLQIEMIRKGDEDRFDKARGMDWTLTGIGQRFDESYKAGHSFTVGSALSNIRLKHKKEEKQEKLDIRRFKQKYKNPQAQTIEE